MIAAPVSAAACGTLAEEEPLTQTNGGTGGLTASGGQTSSSGGGTINSASGGTNTVEAGEGGMGGEDYGIPIYGGPFPDMMKAKV